MNATWIAFAIGMIIGGSIGIMVIGMLSICRDDEEYIMAKPRIAEPQPAPVARRGGPGL